MITESFINYKNYIIRLKFVTNSGCSFSIIKEIPNIRSPNNIKKLYLRTVYYNFMLPLELEKIPKNYIDNFEINLINKFNRLTNERTKI